MRKIIRSILIGALKDYEIQVKIEGSTFIKASMATNSIKSR